MKYNNNTIPLISFYFVRHGQTDWNKTYQTLCDRDDIALNTTGIDQANAAGKILKNIFLTEIYTSPLHRAIQTAQIINNYLNLPLMMHEGLGKVCNETVATAITDILRLNATSLVVSHGEIYRILLRILNAQASDPSPKNGGMYFFQAPTPQSNQWIVVKVNEN